MGPLAQLAKGFCISKRVDAKAPVILVLISALVTAPLFADTIIMKSGESYKGDIIGRTAEYIKLKTDTEVLRIPLSDIARITTTEEELRARYPDTVILKSGETYTGKILEKTIEYIRLETHTEVLRIQVSDIARIVTPQGEFEYVDTVIMKSGQTYSGRVVEATDEYIRLRTAREILKIKRSAIAELTTSEVEVEEGIRRVLRWDAIEKAEAAAKAEAKNMPWFGCGFLLSFVGVLVAYAIPPDVPDRHLMGKSSEYVEAFVKAYKERARSIRVGEAAKGCGVSCILGGCVGCIGVIIELQDAEPCAGLEDFHW